MEGIEITVTQKDIDKGKRWRTQKCPIALAARRSLKSAVAVGKYTLSLQGKRSGWELPDNAKKFIERFDEGKKVKPFSFTL